MDNKFKTKNFNPVKKWKDYQNNPNRLSNHVLTVVALLAAADVLVMVVPFYLKNVIPSVELAKNLGITTAEFSMANSIYGYVAMPSYFLGGYLADKFSLKKLTLIGLGGVGLVCIWYGLIPIIYMGEEVGAASHAAKLAQIYIIFSLWSLLTCFVFWAALWKLLSMQGKPEQNGRLNGAEGSLNGLIGTVLIGLVYLVYFIMGTVIGGQTAAWAFPTLVFIFVAAIVITLILIWKFIPDDKNMISTENATSFSVKSLWQTVKNYRVWLVSFLIMGVYMFQSGLSVMPNILQNGLGVIAIVVVVFGIFRTYLFRAMFSSMFGRMADKKQTYIQFIIGSIIIGSAICLIVVFVPGINVLGDQVHTDASGNFVSLGTMSNAYWIIAQVILLLMYLALGILCWGMVTNRWATIYVINVKQEDYGIAVGFISFIAFSVDAWFWQINASLIKKYGYNSGQGDNPDAVSDLFANQITLLIIVGVGMFGALCGLIILWDLKRKAKPNDISKNMTIQKNE